MEKWKKAIIEKDGFPVKAYVSKNDTRCVVFPLFGRYHTISSDKSALDLFVEVLFRKFSDFDMPAGISSYDSYVNSQEDTAIILQEAA